MHLAFITHKDRKDTKHLFICLFSISGICNLFLKHEQREEWKMHFF